MSAIILNPGTEKASSQCYEVMTTVCMHCGNEIRAENGLFYYIGHPYYGLAHKDCIPYFDFPGVWTHPQPRIFYWRKTHA